MLVVNKYKYYVMLVLLQNQLSRKEEKVKRKIKTDSFN